METPKASVVNFYSGQMDYNLENILTATMLKQVLDLVYMERYVRKRVEHTVYKHLHVSPLSPRDKPSCRLTSIPTRINGNR